MISPYVAGDKLYIPFEGGVHIVNEKSGKEVSAIDVGAPTSSIAVMDNTLVVVNLGGGVTAYDLKSKKPKWNYENDEFGMKNRPLVTLFGNNVLLTEKMKGITVMLNATDGSELWEKQLGVPALATIFGGAITPPSIAEETIFLSVNAYKNVNEGFSSLLALDARTGNELWSFEEEDYSYYAPVLIDNGMIAVTRNGLKAYQGG
jgi:outer membrane protein assembly factor BamB